MKKLSRRAKRNVLVVGIAAIATITAIAINPFNYFGDVDANGIVVRTDDVIGKRICNPQPPAYPGCTLAQVHGFEVGTRDRTSRHYKEKRWGQSGFDFSNMTNATPPELVGVGLGGEAACITVKLYGGFQDMLT